MVKDKTKSSRGLESLLRYTPKPVQGFLLSAWEAKQYIDAGDISGAAKAMSGYVDASANEICDTIRSPEFTIGLYRATIMAAKIAGTVYGNLVGLAAKDLIEYLEGEIEILKIKAEREKEESETLLEDSLYNNGFQEMTIAA